MENFSKIIESTNKQSKNILLYLFENELEENKLIYNITLKKLIAEIADGNFKNFNFIY